MPVNPPTLTLLHSSLFPIYPSYRVTLYPTYQCPGSTRFLARNFPIKLRYPGLPFAPSQSVNLAHRDFSARSRSDSSSPRASESLVEDEAGLSDWVSELRTGTYKTGVFTDDEELPAKRGNVRGRDSSDGRGGAKLGEMRGRGRGGSLRSWSENLGTRVSRPSSIFDSEEEDGRKKNTASVGGGRGGRFQNRGRGRGGRGEKSMGRATVLESDDENVVSREKKQEAIETDDDDDNDEIESRSRSSLISGKGSSSSASGSYLSETSFDQCSVSQLSLKAIKDAGYEKMTVVQEATLPVILKGKDVMAKARTGTGKTVAFLLPSIELVVNSPPADRDQRRQPILVLVMCPTRELATQAAAEAKILLKYHKAIGVQVVMGGTRLAVEQKRVQANPCQILVATPGRLKDHIENTAGFATRLMGVKVLVLDEADRLLDMGFRKDIEKIVSAVPMQRQTLLFSATISDEVRQVSRIALKRDHEYINTVEEGSEATHSQVRQMLMVASMEKHFPLLYTILKDHISDDVNYKVLVFCTTAMVTKLVASMLGELSLNVREIHSRKPQSYRTRVSDEFRNSKGLILVTSDVSARGVDYPDVSLVVQVGVPAGREQYIHRLGRTGRKGKEGQGILLLAPWEESFISSIKDLPITKAPVLTVDPDVKRKVEKALSHVEMKTKESAYQAWLGYYNSSKILSGDKSRLVELANEFSQCMGLHDPPIISRVVLGKMGLKNVPGLRLK